MQTIQRIKEWICYRRINITYLINQGIIYEVGEWYWWGLPKEGMTDKKGALLTSTEKWKVVITVGTLYLTMVISGIWKFEVYTTGSLEDLDLTTHLFNFYFTHFKEKIISEEIFITSEYYSNNWIIWTNEFFTKKSITFIDTMVFATLGYSIGFIGLIFSKKNLISLLISIELLFISITLMYGSAAIFLNLETMQQHALIIMLTAAAESSVGLALLILANQSYKSINTVRFTSLKN